MDKIFHLMVQFSFFINNYFNVCLTNYLYQIKKRKFIILPVSIYIPVMKIVLKNKNDTMTMMCKLIFHDMIIINCFIIYTKNSV